MIHLIELQNVPIFEQLQIEEALLRTDTRNFCVINYGSPKAIVMGISGQAEKLLHVPLVQQDQIPVIRRFSGGGTVVVDEETLFITFIFSKNALDVSPFPESIMRWSADLYADAWNIPGFSLLENDYIIQDKKCGGNAQYIQKDRWLHHTSFLWNYHQENMAYLQLPSKRPKYRQDRGHVDFLCTLRNVGSIPELIDRLKSAIVKRFKVQKLDPKEIEVQPHRQSVVYTHL
ncbi:MAG TPA: lipoate--protein ligase family protein [Chlamydiales bacterium]|nr:lipoate--protein ligase family protein [Chlamydiales bacterium]